MISILFPTLNTALVSVIVTMALASVCGYEPTLASMGSLAGALDPFYSRWLAEALFGAEAQHWTDIFNVSSTEADLGYYIATPWHRLGYALAIGVGVRWLVLACLLWKSRHPGQ